MLKACDIGLIRLLVEPAASNPKPAFERVRARAYGLGLDRSPAGLNQSIKLYYYSLNPGQSARCAMHMLKP